MKLLRIPKITNFLALRIIWEKKDRGV